MWPNAQFPADLVTFTEESFIENFIFCAVSMSNYKNYLSPFSETTNTVFKIFSKYGLIQWIAVYWLLYKKQDVGIFIL